MAVILRRVAEGLFRSGDGIYYALFRTGGRQVKRSLKTSDPALARRALKMFREDVDGRPLAARSDRARPFSVVAGDWLASRKANLRPQTFRRRETALVSINAAFGTIPIRGVTVSHLDSWRASRDASSARTFNIELETIRGVFRWAIDRGLAVADPSARVSRRKERRAQVTIPTREQVRAILADLASSAPGGVVDKAETVRLLRFLAASGARLGEAQGLRWADVGADTFRLDGKSGPRTVPLFPAVREILCDPGAGPVFRIKTARTALAAACRRLSFPRFTHHHLRHFFVSECIEAGIDFKVIASWVGHRDGGVLVARTYGHLRQEHSQLMAKRVTWLGD
jgi:integrase